MDNSLNATFTKFGWPNTKIAELDHWGVMVRPAQPTLGSLVLVCKQPVEAFGEVDAEGYAELAVAIKAIEKILKATIQYEKINYLMLMMEDRDVHFHVLPRYEGMRSFEDLEIIDKGWPAKPDLGHATLLSEPQQSMLAKTLLKNWVI